ncbi:DUF397 domain-containing protein [Actinomadura harenae]|nr:DUF397 domain-containing protein [Actinomadura harenae]
MQHTTPSRSALANASWRKSSRSQAEGAECVELARIAATVCVRDSKDADGPALALSPGHARTLTARIKNGELDL